jgi:hypothetical protein
LNRHDTAHPVSPRIPQDVGWALEIVAADPPVFKSVDRTDSAAIGHRHLSGERGHGQGDEFAPSCCTAG